MLPGLNRRSRIAPPSIDRVSMIFAQGMLSSPSSAAYINPDSVAVATTGSWVGYGGQRVWKGVVGDRPSRNKAEMGGGSVGKRTRGVVQPMEEGDW